MNPSEAHRLLHRPMSMPTQTALTIDAPRAVPASAYRRRQGMPRRKMSLTTSVTLRSQAQRELLEATAVATGQTMQEVWRDALESYAAARGLRVVNGELVRDASQEVDATT